MHLYHVRATSPVKTPKVTAANTANTKMTTFVTYFRILKRKLTV